MLTAGRHVDLVITDWCVEMVVIGWLVELVAAG